MFIAHAELETEMSEADLALFFQNSRQQFYGPLFTEPFWKKEGRIDHLESLDEPNLFDYEIAAGGYRAHFDWRCW